MIEPGTNQKRISIQYWDGVNSTVQQGIALRSELSHSENARAPIIGVLEKREGQTVLGTKPGGGVFVSKGEYGLTFYYDDSNDTNGLIRVSSPDGITSNIYYLNSDDEWIMVDDDLANGRSLSTCDFVNVDSNLIAVNGTDSNLFISSDIDSPTITNSMTAGSLYNSPIANKVAFYKGRIYLADYLDDNSNRLKTTIIRSSYPMGIVSILSGDVSEADESSNWIFPMTDTKYFYIDSGMNEYEIYRGNLKVATITIKSINETSITAADANVTFEVGFTEFLSADEVWIKDTFDGEKQYRWLANTSTIGRDVKQYDTFKLTGGDNDAITLMEPVGNVLMIANKNSMMTWNDYSLETFDTGVGCCSKNGYIKYGALYFIHYTGFYSTTGGVPKLLSRRVERYISGATREGLEAAAVGVKGLSVFCSIGDVTLYNPDGSTQKTLSDVCLEYATADQNWYVHTNVTATKFQKYITSDDVKKLTISSFTAGKDDVLGSEMITNGGFTDEVDPWVIVGDQWAENNHNVLLTLT